MIKKTLLSNLTRIAKIGGGIVLVSIVGCGGNNQDFFPLAQGNKWTFNVKSGLVTRVDEVKVTASDVVESKSGWRLEGPSGPSRLAWSGSSLLAGELSGTRFTPALRLLSGESKSSWKGSITAGGTTESAQASIEEEETKFNLGGQGIPAKKTVLTFQIGSQKRVVSLTFARGLGLVQQEESDGFAMSRQLSYLSGP